MCRNSPEILGDSWYRRQDLGHIFNSYTQNTSHFREKQDTKGSPQPHSTGEGCRKGWRCSGLLSTSRQSSHHLPQPLHHPWAPEGMLSPISASLVLLSQTKLCPGKVPQSGCLPKGCEVLADSLCLTVFPGEGWLQLYPRLWRVQPGVSNQGANLFLVLQAQTQTLWHALLSWGILAPPGAAPALHSFPSKPLEF